MDEMEKKGLADGPQSVFWCFKLFLNWNSGMQVERVLLLVTVWRVMDRGRFLEDFSQIHPTCDQILIRFHRTLLLSCCLLGKIQWS